MGRIAFVVLCGCTLLVLPSAAWRQHAASDDTKGYEYFVTGNPNDVTAKTSYGLLLMGGGKDVESAFRWMIGKSGGGDFVVLRASGTDAYNPFIAGLGKVDSVETLIIKTRAAASDPFIINKIRNAEAVFIAGGDQWNYVRNWKGTPVEDAINFVASKKAPIGGTSAGLAVLGEFLFSAQNDGVTSADALANPFTERVTVDRQFLSLPLMKGIITDSHFVERNRMGRTVAFLSRIIENGWASTVKAIAIDRETAVAVEANGEASIHGKNVAYFIQASAKPEVCQPGRPLTINNLSVYKTPSGAAFNLPKWRGNNGSAYKISASNGALTSSIGTIY
jgi:cyanophycinase